MIDIPQWRASIGAFNSVCQSKKSVTTTIREDYYSIGVSDIYCYKIFIWSASLYCVMYVSFSALCLVLSGDIETNPGPFHRLCPECNEHIHIKKKVCSCGYIFCKKSRNFTKVASPLVSTVNVEISDGCSPEITQTTDCASLLTSPIDVTIKSLDPTTSVGLVDDIAYDASSSTAVGETLHNTHSIATTEDPTLNTHVSKGSPSEGSSAKWVKRSAMVNEKRRLKYKLNPKHKRLSRSKYYHSKRNI